MVTTIYGVPGGGLDAGFSGQKVTSRHAIAAAAKAERDTAEILNRIAGVNGAVVLHDVKIPGKYSANIDHIVVTGSTLHLVDSKAWASGFLWTLGRTTRRGTKRFAACDKGTMKLADDMLRAYLMSRAVRFDSIDSTVVVWPSSRDGAVSTWAARFPHARLIHSGKLDRLAGGWVRRSAPADERIVAALVPLLVTKPRPSGHLAAGLTQAILNPEGW